MTLLKIKGIVTCQTLWGEKGKFIKIFTDQGTLSVRTSTNFKNSAVTQLFVYSDFVLEKIRDTHFIKEAEGIRFFYGLREDLSKLELACYLAKLSKFSQESETLRLFLNTLHFTERGKISLPLLKVIFQLRFLTEIGYKPSSELEIIKHITTAPLEEIWDFSLPKGLLPELILYAEAEIRRNDEIYL